VEAEIGEDLDKRDYIVSNEKLKLRDLCQKIHCSRDQ